MPWNNTEEEEALEWISKLCSRKKKYAHCAGVKGESSSGGHLDILCSLSVTNASSTKTQLVLLCYSWCFQCEAQVVDHTWKVLCYCEVQEVLLQPPAKDCS